LNGAIKKGERMNQADIAAGAVGISLAFGVLLLWYGDLILGGILLVLSGVSVGRLVQLWRKGGKP
jgi:hypothetical protein